MAVRVVSFGEKTALRIAEQTYLEDYAGAVVWDAALVLSHYLHNSITAGNAGVLYICLQV